MYTIKSEGIVVPIWSHRNYKGFRDVTSHQIHSTFTGHSILNGLEGMLAFNISGHNCTQLIYADDTVSDSIQRIETKEILEKKLKKKD